MTGLQQLPSQLSLSSAFTGCNLATDQEHGALKIIQKNFQMELDFSAGNATPILAHCAHSNLVVVHIIIACGLSLSPSSGPIPLPIVRKFQETESSWGWNRTQNCTNLRPRFVWWPDILGGRQESRL